LSGIQRHQDGVEVMTAQGFGHGGAVVVAGDADEARDFLTVNLPRPMIVPPRRARLRRWWFSEIHDGTNVIS